MELRIILSEDEQTLLGVETAEFSDKDALQLLFDATECLARNTERMNSLRGHVPGQRAGLNQAWHQDAVIGGLIEGLTRVAQIEAPHPIK